MSQSASIYRITAETFEILKASPDTFFPFKSCLEYETFNSNHEGLGYIITRNQPEEAKRLLFAIFYPSSSIGGTDTTGFSSEDFENVDGEDFEEAIYYLTPVEVATINALLEEMDEFYFKVNFQPEEMNKEGIYPSVWGEGGFDYKTTLVDFQNLRQLFRKATLESNYLLPYIG